MKYNAKFWQNEYYKQSLMTILFGFGILIFGMGLDISILIKYFIIWALGWSSGLSLLLVINYYKWYEKNKKLLK